MIITEQTDLTPFVHADVIVTRTVDGRRHMHGGVTERATHRVCGDVLIALRRGDELLQLVAAPGELDIRLA